uniref:Uncharacterized protein n=1 Tax=Oryza meridionalis TaxID=40149 RepID=A0A0E0FET6_9ORYZ
MGLLSIIRKIKRKEKKRLAGASLFVLANKQDNQGALKPAEIAKDLAVGGEGGFEGAVVGGPGEAADEAAGLL